MTAAARGWCEAGLGICALLLMPLLAIVPHGAAPLAAVAGLCAAGLVWADPPERFAALAWPAAMLAALLSWGALSAAWSIEPQRSLMMAARLAGLFAAGLALAAAAGRIGSPRRLVLLLFAGIAIGITLTGYDLASGGGLSRQVSVRAFHPFRLNQIAVGLTILVLPVAALLLCRGRVVFALAAAAVIGGTVCLLADSAAKTGLALSLPVAALLYRWRGPVARAAAILTLLAILTAPLTLPRLAGLPEVFAAADSFKVSAGHRLLIWSFVGDRITERALLGWGLDASRAIPGGNEEIRPGQNRLSLHPHNAALQVWLELGLPGAMLFALFAGWVWLRVARAPWPPVYAAAAGGSLIAALATAGAAYGIWQEWWLGTLGVALFLVLVMARATEAPAPSPTPPPRPGWRGAGR